MWYLLLLGVAAAAYAVAPVAPETLGCCFPRCCCWSKNWGGKRLWLLVCLLGCRLRGLAGEHLPRRQGIPCLILREEGPTAWGPLKTPGRQYRGQCDAVTVALLLSLERNEGSILAPTHVYWHLFSINRGRCWQLCIRPATRMSCRP